MTTVDSETRQPAHPDMEREILIRGEMRRKHLSGAAIALANGLTRGMVNNTITGRWKSARVRKIIADEIGMEYETLWGDE